ncbi:helix-turn-helix domain-containing protein [Streptomyces sp. NPDC004783]|uniref:helix-turn-helix domain-containing protein n=1 Tax=Streptomyces sp. NPDC004783 TaxID=3154459 RepID=UPI0033BD750C
MDAIRDIAEQQCLDSLLTTIVRRARTLLRADISVISLYDEGMSVQLAQDGLMTPIGDLRDSDVRPGDSRRGGTRVWTADGAGDEKFRHDELADRILAQEGVRAVMARPLTTREGVIGLLLCADRETRSYASEDISLMSFLADYTASTVERFRALDEARGRIARVTSEYDRLRARLYAEQRVGRAGRRMHDVVLEGADAHAVANELAEALSVSVALRDESDRTVAVSGSVPEDGGELDAAVLEARAENRTVRVGEDTTVLPVNAGGENLGALIIHADRPLTEPCHDVAAHAARAAAFLALVNRSAASIDGQARDEALDALLDHPGRDPQRVVQLTQRLGVNLTQPHVVVVAHAEGAQRGRLMAWASPYVVRQGGAKTMRDGCLVLLLPGDDAGVAARDVSRLLGQALNRPVTAGGAPADGGQNAVANGYGQAKRCVEALTSMGRHGATATVEELGFVGMLLGGSRDVGGFIEQTLGPVLYYDEERSTELVSTLEAYFAAGSSPTYAAEALQVHPNTVFRRLERIAQLLGPDWQEPARALEVQLALRLQRVCHSLPDTPSPDPS